MLKNCLILLHVKRTDKAIIPRFIQFGSWLQIISERLKIAGIKKAFKEAKQYNVNHTALVYCENGVYRVFQANTTNNVHVLLLSDYLANTKAQIYASIHFDAEYTQESKEMLLKWINIYQKKVKYNIYLAFLAWRPVRKLFPMVFKNRKLDRHTLCSDIVIRLFEKVFKKDIKDFLYTTQISFFKENHSNAPWRIFFGTCRKQYHDSRQNLTNTRIIDTKEDIIKFLLK
tara:strand:- start:2118 stop:2804 length:687 start_codon:yes stop_codon:yes gene_type:complete